MLYQLVKDLALMREDRLGAEGAVPARDGVGERVEVDLREHARLMAPFGACKGSRRVMRSVSSPDIATAWRASLNSAAIPCSVFSCPAKTTCDLSTGHRVSRAPRQRAVATWKDASVAQRALRVCDWEQQTLGQFRKPHRTCARCRRNATHEHVRLNDLCIPPTFVERLDLIPLSVPGNSVR
eukprot:451179-Rhodomonas_salina.1